MTLYSVADVADFLPLNRIVEMFSKNDFLSNRIVKNTLHQLRYLNP